MSIPEVPRSAFAEQLRTVSAQLKGLAALQAEAMAAMEQIQDVVVFSTHPELVDLDSELDNCYPDLDS